MQSSGLLVRLLNYPTPFYLNQISDRGAKDTKVTKLSIISSISSIELTSLKSLIKLHN